MAITKIDITMLEDVTGANNLVKLDANAKIPACSGASLSVKPGPTKSASDPAVDSNKSLGAEWLNTTDGEMFICTDATAGANVWTNVGAGTGDIIAFHSWGENYGYAAGGYDNPTTGPGMNTIQKYSFTSNANATDVADLTQARKYPGGMSSTTHGYTTGGGIGGTTAQNIIDKFPFASASNATDVGDMVADNFLHGSNQSSTYGYASGGCDDSNTPSYNTIQKFSFTTDGNATDIGDITDTRSRGGGSSSATHGYTAGGVFVPGWTYKDRIDKFSFTTDGDATDVGNLTSGGAAMLGSSTQSSTYGYCFGREEGYPGTTAGFLRCDKYSFASDGNTTAVGNISVSRTLGSGTSSTSYGYFAGGTNDFSNFSNVIDRVSFSTDGNSTDVGNLLAESASSSGNQY